MKENRLNDLLKEESTRRLLGFIPNELGINLCSVDDVVVNRQSDGQIRDIQIKFNCK